MNYFFSYLLRPVYYFSSTENSLKLAVIWDDIYGVRYILSNKLKDIVVNKKIIQNSESFLSTTYNNANSFIAEELIKIGFNFKGEYILYAKTSIPFVDISYHLKNIQDFINQDEFHIADQITIARYADPLVIIQNNSCIDHLNVALSLTHISNRSYNDSFISLYKNFYDSNNKIQSLIIKDIILAIGAGNHLEQIIKIISPLIEDIDDRSFYDNQRKLLYTPLYSFSLKEQSVFIHEASHYLMHDQFKNTGKPFHNSNKNAIAAYDQAAIKSLLSIGSIIGFKYDNGLPKTHTSISVAFDLLFKSTISLFHFSSVLSTRKIASADRDFVLNEIIEIFDLDNNLVELYGKEQTINILKQQIVIDFNITTDQIIILERIGEYAARANHHSYFNELIVRLPEFIVRGLNDNALLHLDPLQNFWLEYISPAINESIYSLGIKKCDFFILKDIENLVLGDNISSAFSEEL
jgi:hypothetical protein